MFRGSERSRGKDPPAVLKRIWKGGIGFLPKIRMDREPTVEGEKGGEGGGRWAEASFVRLEAEISGGKRILQRS